jgi:hypothetical protein
VQCVILDRRVFSLSQMFLFLIFRLELCNRIRNLNYNKVKFSDLFIVNILVCDVLYVITLIMTPRNDPGLD